MNFKSNVFFALLLCTVLPLKADLVSRENGRMVYDTDLNITWLADANFISTSGYDADGLVTWRTALQFAANAEIDGIGGWRLPDMPHNLTLNDLGFNNTSSEMGHLFYEELGGVAGSSIFDTHNSNFSYFTNIQSCTGENSGSWSYGSYWGAQPIIGDRIPIFVFDDQNAVTSNENGLLTHIGSTSNGYVWLVHDGDVGAASVPEPGIVLLLLFGMGALFVMRIFFKKTDKNSIGQA